MPADTSSSVSSISGLERSYSEASSLAHSDSVTLQTFVRDEVVYPVFIYPASSSSGMVRDTGIATSRSFFRWAKDVALLTSSSATISYETEKTSEARRQVQRLLNGKLYLSEEVRERLDSSDAGRASYAAAVALIQGFVASPFDVPIASYDEDGKPSLLLVSEDLYLDVSLDQGELEFYLRGRLGEKDIESLDVETVGEPRLPPKLLAALISVYKNK